MISHAPFGMQIENCAMNGEQVTFFIIAQMGSTRGRYPVSCHFFLKQENNDYLLRTKNSLRYENGISISQGVDSCLINIRSQVSTKKKLIVRTHFEPPIADDNNRIIINIINNRIIIIVIQLWLKRSCVWWRKNMDTVVVQDSWLGCLLECKLSVLYDRSHTSYASFSMSNKHGIDVETNFGPGDDLAF